MKKEIHIAAEKTILELQDEFRALFPYLNLEFYKTQDTDPRLIVRKHLSPTTLLKAAGAKNAGVIEVENDLTVAELEKSLRENFGLVAQVTRQSGTVWLVTTMTDDWTLRQQNEHGREITKGLEKPRQTG